jgi:hypothetical protein
MPPDTLHTVLIDSLIKVNVIIPDSMKIVQKESVNFMKEHLWIFPFWTWQIIIFPLVIGFALFWFTRGANKIKEKNRIKDLWNFIVLWLENSIDEIQGLYNYAEQYENHFKEAKMDSPDFRKLHNNVSRILTIPNEDLYRAFIAKRKIKNEVTPNEFYILILHLEVTENIFNTYNSGIKDMIATLREFIDKIEELGKRTKACKTEREKQFFELGQKSDFEQDKTLKEQYKNLQTNLGQTINGYNKVVADSQKEFLKDESLKTPTDYKKYPLKRIQFLTEQTQGVEMYFSDDLANEIELMDINDRLHSKYLEFSRRFAELKNDAKNIKSKVQELKDKFVKLKWKSWLKFPG